MQNFPDIGKAIDEMQRVLDYNPGYMIISYLKKAPNAKEIESKIKGSFKKRIVSVIEERKDMIFFLKI